MGRWWLTIGTALMFAVAAARAEEMGAIERGKKALLGRAFNPPFWSKDAWNQLWQQWGDGRKEAPTNYTEAIQERYGLHPAPYDNAGYPMGMRESTFLLRKSVGSDCLLCHAGSIAGRSYVGLGNASLDMQSLYEELNAAEGRGRRTPFTFSNVRGTNEAGNMAVYLIAFREPDLTMRARPLPLGVRDDLCEDVPAWWLLKKKKTMYHTGGTDARSVRSLMQFMMHPLNSADAIKNEEATFRDIQAFLLSLQPPKYPLPIDADRARQGAEIFRENCARCHGTRDGNYPNKIIPLEVIGTDRTRYDGISEKFGRHYNQSWFAQEKRGWLGDEFFAGSTPGYQAPPLDGIWASAPYLHNGSAPTVYHVLNSKARPKVFTRSYRTGLDDYDPVKLGWKIRVLDGGADPKLPPLERRKIYDTTLTGRGNAGHTFGDKLSDAERTAVIEYLKTW